MDATLQAQRSLTSCGFTDCANQLSVRPVLELSTYRPITRYLQSHSWRIKCPTSGGLHQVSASSDFSKRRPRKGSSSRARGSGPTSKGYLPKAPAGTGTHRGNKRTSGDDGNSATSSSVPHEKTPEKRVFSEGWQETVPDGGRAESQSGDETNGKVIELSQGNGQPGGDGRSRLKQNSSIQGNHEGGDESMCSAAVGDDRRSLATLQDEPMSLMESGCVQKSSTEVGDEEESVVLDENERHLLASVDDQKGLVACGEEMKSVAAAVNSTSGYVSVEEGSECIQGKSMITSEQQIETGPGKIDAQVLKSELSRHPDDALAQRDEDDHSKKLELELEAQRLRQVVEELAEVAFLAQKKLFTYPQLVKPGEDIELFFNRSLSPLRGEPNVSVMGAYNDWRWKSFTIKMDKSNLNGDWWSCKIRVPEEAYTIDFVFFNGENVYDNNNKDDFHITVEGGMDAVGFEDYLLGEKRREHEKLARAQADKERQEEEQRRIEEEVAAIESHRAQAKADVQSRRTKLQPLIKKAAKYVVNLWHLETCEIQGENLVRLYYNRSSGPLALANEIWIHGGINNWRDGLSICAKLEKSEKKDADWWYTVVSVPDEAFVLDWVFADGVPHKATVYDNNYCQDFHAIIPKSISEEQYWAEEEERIFEKLQQERMEMMEAICAKAEKTALLKAKAKEKALKRFLMSRKHIVYTEPLDVRAGGNVTVYYNPSNTVLRGKPEVWFRCSFNRWTHHKGSLLPQKMVPVENVSHVKTTVKVPLDAYIMDFVFSEKEDGGISDNNNGVDYHVPIFGGIVKEPPMHIVHVAVEMAPIAKVGGLGDVVTSLSRAVKDLNHHVDIILPKYDCLNLSNVKDLQCTWSYHWGGTEIKVWYGRVEGLPVYFLEPCNGFFWTGCIYGCRNDAERFGFFSHAALEFLQQNGLHPDIIHCHDWSSAPVAWLHKDHYRQYGLSKARVVFTIHNLEFGAPLIGKAMEYSDKATTVSPTYSMEVAANPVIAPNILKFHGIINGIDPDIWDPYNDKFLPVSYTSENVIEGKRAAKEALQKKLGLKIVDVPLVGVISRLTQQKGIHLIKHAIWRTLERDGQFILLGSAPDPRIQIDFVNLANQLHSTHGDCAHLCLSYDEPLSHLIYAAADFILVPSVFEPCGLTQLVAMRYGAIPVVRKTGGLHDTVFDVDHDKERAEAEGLQPNGFNFEGVDAPGVDYALNRAISAWYDRREWFDGLCKCVMEQDWSWNGPALDYLELYHAARKN